MELIIASLSIYGFGALAALLSGKHAKRTSAIAVTACLMGSLAGLLALWLTRGETISWQTGWSMPGGQISLTLDSLARFFLLIFYTILIPIALYGYSYMTAYPHRNLAPAWFFFLILIAAMDLVILADNMMLFLLAWEVMSVAAFFVVLFEDEKPQVRQAGYIYFIASHIGTAFLFVLFWVLNQSALTGAHKTLFLMLGLIGFGVKAGLTPLHVWLPEAHPAAPSHVSALMSGLLIKTGLYGILRLLLYLSPLPAHTGEVLLLLGLVSGFTGILYALAEKDLKRLLAYSSVENMGIIFIGLGIGFIAIEHQAPTVALFALSGAFLHVLNHAILKPMLFMSAGSVYQHTHTRNLEQLGGLLKTMPNAGHAFLFGATGLAGLPPLNGFAGELLIYIAGFHGIGMISKGLTVWPIAAIIGLALIGGLASFTFAKAFGIAFLGEPRSEQAVREQAVPHWTSKAATGMLATLALAVVAGSFLLMEPGKPLLAQFYPAMASAAMDPLRLILLYYAGAALVLTMLTFLLVQIRKKMLAGRSVERSVTWDCGYAAPTSHMQYSASSFAAPLTDLLTTPLDIRRNIIMPQEPLPGKASLSITVRDIFISRVYEPLFDGVDFLFVKLQWLQHGKLNFYILYIAVTLLALLLWYGGSR